MQGQTIVGIPDLLSKFRTKQDRINFAREQNKYLPDLPGFDSKFFFEFLRGTKDLLPIGTGPGFTFNYFSKDHKFTKSYLWDIFRNNNDLLRFIPSLPMPTNPNGWRCTTNTKC